MWGVFWLSDCLNLDGQDKRIFRIGLCVLCSLVRVSVLHRSTGGAARVPLRDVYVGVFLGRDQGGLSEP